MTKEVILQKEYVNWIEEKGISSIYPTLFPVAYKDSVLAAMDEYAKQQSIAFAIAYAKGVLMFGHKKVEDIENDRMEDRYNLFIEQQQNK